MREMEKTVSQKIHQGTTLFPENMSQFFHFFGAAGRFASFCTLLAEADSRKQSSKKEEGGVPEKCLTFFTSIILAPYGGRNKLSYISM